MEDQLPSPAAPVAAMNARLGWNLLISEAVLDEPPCLVIQATPRFPSCGSRLAERGIVWDVFSLMESAKRPGEFQLLNADSGVAQDAGLRGAIFVSHPDEHSLVWELDIESLRPALDMRFENAQRGFLRLVFRRDDYEADVRRLIRDLQRSARGVARPGRIPEGLSEGPFLVWPECSEEFVVGALEPDLDGLALERLLALDDTAAWPRELPWPAGSQLELGFFEDGDAHVWLRVNGRPAASFHEARVFTRWQIWSSFERWLSYKRRGFGLGRDLRAPAGAGPNHFILLDERNRQALHEVGSAFAGQLQRGLQEGRAEPGVSVIYRELAIAAAVPR